MKIGVRLFIGFGSVVLAMLVVIAFCLNTSKIVCAAFEESKGDIVPGAMAMSEMVCYAQQIHLLTMRHSARGELEERQLQSAMRKLEKAGADHLEREEYIGSGSQVAAKELLRKIRTVNSAAMEVAKLRDEGATVNELTAKVNNEFHPLVLKLLDHINEDKAVRIAELAAAEEAVHGAYTRGLRYGLLASAFAVLLAIGIALAATRSIVEPLKALYKSTKTIGQGDLNCRVGTDAKDEIGQLSRAFDLMTAGLKKTTTSVDSFNAAKQQLQASEQQLQAINQQLQCEVAARKRLEEALEALNGELRDFVHMASHDLREPLRKISSFGLLLNDSLDGKVEQEDQENLRFMIDGAKRMTQMIEDLLAYSRVSAKAVALEMLDLNDVVEQSEQLELAALLEETGAVIEIPEPLPKVQADPVLIRQLLQNLVINGIKYRREGVQPRILITAEAIAEDVVRIDVQDNGIGIEQKDHEHIFKMFKRLHSRQESEGAGTGLAMCKKIVGKHGGRIGVESKAGAGSTFWFTLPTSKSLEREQDKLISSVEA